MSDLPSASDVVSLALCGCVECSCTERCQQPHFREQARRAVRALSSRMAQHPARPVVDGSRRGMSAGHAWQAVVRAVLG